MFASPRHRLFLVSSVCLAAIIGCAGAPNPGSTGNGSTADGGVDAGDAGTIDGGADAGPGPGLDAGPMGTTDAGNGSANVAGTISGDTITATGAVFIAPDQVVEVLITDVSQICVRLGDNTPPANSHVLSFGLQQSDSTGAATTATPGLYNVGQPVALMQTAQAQYSSYDATCTQAHSATATVGVVTVTSVDTSATGSVQGNFDLTFGTDHVTGSFDAPGATPAPVTAVCQ